MEFLRLFTGEKQKKKKKKNREKKNGGQGEQKDTSYFKINPKSIVKFTEFTKWSCYWISLKFLKD